MSATIDFDGTFYGVTVRNSAGMKLWTRAFETKLEAIGYCVAGGFIRQHGWA
jgi:hypothetical protein